MNIVKLTLGLVSLETLSWSRPTIMYTEYSQPFVAKKTFDMKLFKRNNDIFMFMNIFNTNINTSYSVVGKRNNIVKIKFPYISSLQKI